MPIRAEHPWLYPIDWPQLSAVIRFERAGGRCEHCARPHGHLVCHLGDGRWWDEEQDAWRDGRGRLVTLALPQPTAFCQRCHCLHDRPEHQRRRWITLRMRKAIGDLFLGRYSELS